MLTNNRQPDKIIESVLALAEKKEIHAITISDICAEAHISKSTFYKSFSSKEDIFSDLYVAVNSDVMEALPAILISDASALQKYWIITRYFPQRSQELGPVIIAYMGESGFISREHAFLKGKEFYDPISDSLLEKAQKEGLVRTDAAPSELHDILHFYLAGITMEWCKQGGSFDLVKKTFDGMMTIFGAHPDFGPNDDIPLAVRKTGL